MNFAWVAQMEALWRSPSFPMWATLAAALFFGVVVLITLMRADRSVANGALAIITLLAIGVAAAATTRGKSEQDVSGPAVSVVSASAQTAALPVAGQGVVACLDGLAGDRVEQACERSLFASADSTAAAVSYTAAQLARLPVAANLATPELSVLRRVLERDRYGLVAQVLTVREGCTPKACDTFRYLVNSSQIIANMEEYAFEAMVRRHEATWDGPTVASAGRPNTIDYPSAASTPPVSIMTAEPAPASAPVPAAAPPSAAPASSGPLGLPTAVLPFPQAPMAQAPAPGPQAAPSASRKAAANAPAPSAPKRASTAPPVQLVPQ